MEAMTITPTSKKELKEAVSSTIQVTGETFYNWFEGKIRKGDKYAKVSYWYERNRCIIQVTYWQDGKDCAVETASRCSSYRGLVSKVAKFLCMK